MLEKTFQDLAANYISNQAIVSKLWKEVETQYSENSRHYHTLAHLENLLEQLKKVKSEIADWNTVLFSLFYHDIIYKARKSDNEAKSAELAKLRMTELAVPKNMVDKCCEQILATKGHNISLNLDTNFFTDADLSILGSEWERYTAYYKNVRKEYAIFPDFIFNRGRKKVLRHFLDMDKIYKTEYFFNHYEAKARDNMQRELKEAF